MNDATSPDGAQEYGVVKIDGPNGTPLQVESITVSWMTLRQLTACIREAFAGAFDRKPFAHDVDPTVQTPEEHGRCRHCA